MKLHGLLQLLCCCLAFIQVLLLTNLPILFSEGLSKYYLPGMSSLALAQSQGKVWK